MGTFDTLTYAESLREAGVDEKQAAAQAHALKQAFSEEVASKSDLKQLEIDVKGGMETLKVEMQYIKWGIGVIVVGIVGIFSKLVFFTT